LIDGAGSGEGLPMASFRHFVAFALCQIACAVLGHHWPDLVPIFFKFSRVGDDVLNNYPERVAVIEFPDMNSLNTWYSSSEYQPLKALRKESTSDQDMMFFLEGV